jgi:hypothetical protein
MACRLDAGTVITCWVRFDRKQMGFVVNGKNTGPVFAFEARACARITAGDLTD